MQGLCRREWKIAMRLARETSCSREKDGQRTHGGLHVKELMPGGLACCWAMGVLGLAGFCLLLCLHGSCWAPILGLLLGLKFGPWLGPIKRE